MNGLNRFLDTATLDEIAGVVFAVVFLGFILAAGAFKFGVWLARRREGEDWTAESGMEPER